MKVLFLTNVPSPYRVLFFNELGKYCDLTVLYQKSSSSERDGKWVADADNNYKKIVMRGKNTGVDQAFCPEVVQHLRDMSYDIIVICGIASPTEIIAIEWCKLHRRHYCLESDGGFAKNGRGFKERVKRHIVSGADLYFSTGVEHDKYYMTYGAEKSRIVRYPFTSLLKSDVLIRAVTEEEKKQIRRDLGIKEEQVVLSVGRFSYKNGYGKGYDTVLQTAEKLSSDIGIYIVGDEPTDEFVAWKKNKKLDQVHFVGFKKKQELAQYYRAADAFVLMTRGDVWGLVVNEAMGFGLPVITTNKCIAGMEMVDDGLTGYILSVGDVEGLQEAIGSALTLDCAEKCLEVARRYTIEEMAKAHMHYFKLLKTS